MNGILIVPAERLTGFQRRAWLRDVEPFDCTCDRLWTGVVWTRSGTDPDCPEHGAVTP